MKRVLVSVVVVFLLGLAGLLFWLARDTPVAGAEAAVPAQPQTLAEAKAAASSETRYKTGLEQLPGSLRDTEVDGSLETDAAGNLKITVGIRQVFDYFLSASGEEPLSQIIARIRAYIRSKLPAGAAAQAEQILDSYLAYRDALGTLPQASASDLNALREQVEAVKAVRQRFLSAEVVAAFFGDEDAYDRYTLDRMAVMQNASLSPQEKAKRTAAMLEQLPPALKDNVKVVTQYQTLSSLTEDWQKRGGSPAELRSIREQVVGPEAANRLEALDQERGAWDGRMQAYLSQRDAVLRNPALAPADREGAVAELRKQQFSDTEQVRVGALERIHDQGGKP